MVFKLTGILPLIYASFVSKMMRSVKVSMSSVEEKRFLNSWVYHIIIVYVTTVVVSDSPRAWIKAKFKCSNENHYFTFGDPNLVSIWFTYSAKWNPIDTFLFKHLLQTHAHSCPLYVNVFSSTYWGVLRQRKRLNKQYEINFYNART